MGGKDISEKMLEEYSDVFADIFNGLLFEGRKVIDPEDLTDVPGQRSQFRADDGALHEQERDVSKFWGKEGSILSLLGIENQTRADPDAVLRVISYDGASYKSQLLKDSGAGDKAARTGSKGFNRRFPAVTLVLYFGADRWRYPLSLKDRLLVPEELDGFVSDYRINVFEMSYLTPEQVDRFTSDFRILAEYCVRSRLEADYKPSDITIKHVDELLKVLGAVSGDRSYEALIPRISKKEKITMMTVFEQANKERAHREGLIIGQQLGQEIGQQLGQEIGQEIGQKMAKEASVKTIYDLISRQSLSIIEGADYLGKTVEELRAGMEEQGYIVPEIAGEIVGRSDCPDK